MSKSIPVVIGKTVKRQLTKSAVTKSTGLDEYLDITPLNENEDVVINELRRPNSPAAKDVSLWNEQDFNNAINSYRFSDNYMLQSMCEEYLKRRKK